MEKASSPGGKYAPGAGGADTGNAQKSTQVGGHDLHWKLLRMGDGPVAFRIQHRVKIRVLVIQKLIGPEAIKPQEPICLIQPMLPQKRRLSVQVGKQRIFHNGHI